MDKLFSRFANKVSELMGSHWSFIAALVLILAWAVTGPIFHFSNTWQLVVNTATTIVTFVMVFLIQNTQNRDARAIHLKLDDLLEATHGAHGSLVDLEDRTTRELKQVKEQMLRHAEEAGREQS